MFTLIKNANLYSPEHLGMNDVLLADDKIALIDRKIELTGIPFDTIDAGGCAVTPRLYRPARPHHRWRRTNRLCFLSPRRLHERTGGLRNHYRGRTTRHGRFRKKN